MQNFDFENLNVYKKALKFIHDILEIYKKLPREFQYSIGDNLVRAGMSIANNLAEGSGKNLKKKKFVIILSLWILQGNASLYLMFCLGRVS